VTGVTLTVDAAFQAHRSFLWHLCYRMTGVAADADDLVQDTFLRAIERPPPRLDADLRPWLVRVALNRARDLLRRRRRRAYAGPWLPAPLETGDEETQPAFEPTVPGLGSTEGRYDLVESVTFAFLLALEALTPQQRAVLLLRDVFDYSVRETAAALELSEANVKTTLHRARRAMAAYDRTRRPPTRDLCAETRQTLGRLVGAIFTGDVADVEALLTDDVRALSDGAGESHAARRPVVGKAKVALFFTRLAARRTAGARIEVRMLNGLPALVADFGAGRPGDPPRGVIRIELAPDGRVREIHAVLAARKLSAVRFGPT
jgi:RNA polymerase sigma factor (sigma-70 family)